MVSFEHISQPCYVDFEHVIAQGSFFHYKHQRFHVFCIENVIFLLSFLKNDCFLKIFFPRFKSHFRLVQMILKSITLMQNHKVIEHFYYNNTIFFILLVQEIHHGVNR